VKWGPVRSIYQTVVFIGLYSPFNFIISLEDPFSLESDTFVKSIPMKTIIVNVPDKDEALFSALLMRLGLRSRPLTDEDREEQAMAKWIEEGLKTKEVATEEVLKALRKGGVEI